MYRLTKRVIQQLHKESFKQNSFFKSYYQLMKANRIGGPLRHNAAFASRRDYRYDFVIAHSISQYRENLNCKNFEAYAKIGREIYLIDFDKESPRHRKRIIKELEEKYLNTEKPLNDKYYGHLRLKITKNTDKIRNDKLSYDKNSSLDIDKLRNDLSSYEKNSF